jgi:hypothetical protein
MVAVAGEMIRVWGAGGSCASEAAACASRKHTLFGETLDLERRFGFGDEKQKRTTLKVAVRVSSRFKSATSRRWFDLVLKDSFGSPT